MTYHCKPCDKIFRHEVKDDHSKSNCNNFLISLLSQDLLLKTPTLLILVK